MAFFDFGPTLLLPLPDGGRVPLGRPVYWSLAAPATGFQDASHLGRVVGDPEPVSDQGGHSRLGPDLSWEAESFRSLGQEFQQLASLFWREA
jgi:hypothetical protein